MWRVTIIAAVPVLVALVVGALRTANTLSEAADLRTATAQLEVRDRVEQAADLLRAERAAATVHIANGRAQDYELLLPVFDRSSTAIGGALLAGKNISDLSPATIDAIVQIRNGLVDLAPLRRAVIQQSGLTSQQARVRYSSLVGLLDTLDRALLRQVRAPQSAELVDALSATVNVKEQLAQQHDIIAAAIIATKLDPSDAALATAADTRITSDYQTYLIALGEQRSTTFGAFLDGPANRTRADQLGVIVASPPTGPINVPVGTWDQAYEGSRAAVGRSSERLDEAMRSSSRSAASSASTAAAAGAGLLVFALLSAVAIATVFGKSLVRALGILQRTALEVASRRLPAVIEDMRTGNAPDTSIERVPLDTVEEVGQVARAFDAVHSQAVLLAAEQATLQANVSAMFVNLSRRSQALVDRQLQVIETLEGGEVDPDLLASLFKLDHLATRMRRNSENLLVLAGNEPVPRSAAAASTEDVLRAAVSEIARYERAIIETAPAVMIAGRATSDLSRLLAELLDNAVTFSPPTEPVIIRAMRRHGGSIVIEVVDNGVGMTAEELRHANERLKGTGSVDLTVTRRMGLFVVGRLSLRHGVRVRLVVGAVGGVRAVVAVPAALVAESLADPGTRTDSAETLRLRQDETWAGSDIGTRLVPEPLPSAGTIRPTTVMTKDASVLSAPRPAPRPSAGDRRPTPTSRCSPPGPDDGAHAGSGGLFVSSSPPKVLPASLGMPAAGQTSPAASPSAAGPAESGEPASAWFIADRSMRLDWDRLGCLEIPPTAPSIRGGQVVGVAPAAAIPAVSEVGLPRSRTTADPVPGSIAAAGRPGERNDQLGEG